VKNQQTETKLTIMTMKDWSL